MKRRTTLFILVLLAVCLALLVGCGPDSMVKTSDGSAALSDDDISWRSYHYKAISPDGAVVVVREHDNEEEGSLEFWAAALERDVVETQGYKLMETAEVKAGSLKGKQLKFEVLYGGEPYRYDVALFVTKDVIVTVETAGEQAVFEKHAEALQKAIESLYFD